jgi:hypothetical protein
MDRRDKYHKLYSCYLKLERAQQHASVLQDAMDQFLATEPYAIIYEHDPKLDEYILRAKVREEPPPEWSPVIGDIVHNWRSALDHLAYQLIIRNGQKSCHRTQFPIFSKSLFGKGEGYKLFGVFWRTRITYLLAASFGRNASKTEKGAL